MRYFPLTRGFIVTSGFRTPQRPDHWGTDFGRDGGSGGNSVHAMQGGTVVMVGAASGFGQWVVLDHPTADGSGTTVYGHVLPEVGLNQRVEAGQRIARINPVNGPGNGNVPPHLHAEVHRSVWASPGPDRLDPWPWLGDAAFPGETPPPSAGNVTQYGIDVSNNQGAFDFAQARAEGFVFATHKVLEIDGREFPDRFWPRARDELARHFPGRWGGYIFCRRSNDPRHEADRLAHYAGARDFPLQIDYEDTKGGGSRDDLWARYNAYREVGFTRFLPVYLPRWFWDGHMGRPNLADFPLPIWNSHYVTGTGFASSLYPGDTHPGWADVGGKPVAILQFTDKARVAGQAIDANAVRGADTLAAMFGGDPEDLDMSAAEDIKRHFEDFIRGYLDPVISDVKDLREQSTGARDLIRRDDGTVDVEASFPGWTQLGDDAQAKRTEVDGLARVLEKQRHLEARIAALEVRD